MDKYQVVFGHCYIAVTKRIKAKLYFFGYGFKQNSFLIGQSYRRTFQVLDICYMPYSTCNDNIKMLDTDDIGDKLNAIMFFFRVAGCRFISHPPDTGPPLSTNWAIGIEPIGLGTQRVIYIGPGYLYVPERFSWQLSAIAYIYPLKSDESNRRELNAPHESNDVKYLQVCSQAWTIFSHYGHNSKSLYNITIFNINHTTIMVK